MQNRGEENLKSSVWFIIWHTDSFKIYFIANQSEMKTPKSMACLKPGKCLYLASTGADNSAGLTLSANISSYKTRDLFEVIQKLS